MDEHNIITTYNFNEHEFLVKTNIANNLLEISITDKHSAEEWHCNYDNLYIENLTQKTGNYKQFKIFASMLKAGLLKTSNCISLDLLTYEDLEALRIRRIKHNTSHFINQHLKNNRRYLILIYNVEFDRILYPLPLEYCGPPDPAFLQATIRKLEEELRKCKDELEVFYSRNDFKLHKRLDELECQNRLLKRQLADRNNTTMHNNRSNDKIRMLEMNLSSLETKVHSERRLHNKVVSKLKTENESLMTEITRLKQSEMELLRRLRSRSSLQSPVQRNAMLNKRTQRPDASVKTLYNKGNEFEDDWRGYRKCDGGSQKARSVCEPSNVTQRPSRSRLRIENKVISRGSSRSSKSSAKSCTYNNDLYRIKSISKSASRDKLSLDRSRSSSVCSHHSGASDTMKSTYSLRMKMRHSEEEFRMLENRINSLQKLLKENDNT